MTAPPPFIPFLPGFHEPIRARRKTMTARTRKYGNPGDYLRSPAGLLRLVDVDRIPLRVVAERYWRQEGVDGPEDFARVWKQIHPQRGFQPEDLVWLHEFEIVADDTVTEEDLATQGVPP